MHSEPRSSVVVEIATPRRSSVLAWWRRRGRRADDPGPGFTVFVVSEDADGNARISRSKERSPDPSSLPPRATLARVRGEPRLFEVPFAAVSSDSEAQRWDVVFRGTWSVSNPERFLTEHALAVASEDDPLYAEDLASWIFQELRPRVIDSVRSYSIKSLRKEDALPLSWWEGKFSECLAPVGIAIALREVRWESEDEERAAEERQRGEHTERVLRNRERKREALLREARSAARYEEEKARVTADRQLSGKEQTHELRLLEERHRHEILDARREAVQAVWAHEQAALEHEAQMARMRRDIDALDDAEEQLVRAEEKHREMTEQLSEATAALERLTSMADPLLTHLGDRSSAAAHQAAERLTSPEFGIAAATLETMGFSVDPQSFINGLRQVRARGAPVTLEMIELRTRDIGTARIDSLAINSSLQFEFEAPQTGYLTLLNVGTSGTVWLQCPNPFVGPAEARVEAGRRYSIPGPELLPEHEIGGYYECGPPGWEHLGVLITDQPLMTPDAISGVREAPFTQIGGEELQNLASALLGAAEPPAVGLLSFLVE